MLPMYDLILSDTPNEEGAGEITGLSVSHLNDENGPAHKMFVLITLSNNEG